MKITKEADYIAQTEGNRNYPWRNFVITSEDSQLIENTMNYKKYANLPVPIWDY